MALEATGVRDSRRKPRGRGANLAVVRFLAIGGRGTGGCKLEIVPASGTVIDPKPQRARRGPLLPEFPTKSRLARVPIRLFSGFWRPGVARKGAPHGVTKGPRSLDHKLGITLASDILMNSRAVIVDCPTPLPNGWAPPFGGFGFDSRRKTQDTNRDPANNLAKPKRKTKMGVHIFCPSHWYCLCTTQQNA